MPPDDNGFQNLEITFGALDTNTDPTLLPAGGLTLAENATSQVSDIYIKRNGYTALAALGSGIMRLAVLGLQLLACDGNTVYSYDSIAPAWHAPGSIGGPAVNTMVPAAVSQTAVILDQSTDILISTTAVANGLRTDAWIDVTNNFVTVQLSNDSTGAIISRSVVDSTGRWAFIHSVAVGATHIDIVFASTTMQKLNEVVVDCAAETVTASTALQSGANVSNTYAVMDVVAASSTEVIVAWQNNAGVVRAWRRNPITAASVAGPNTVAAEAVDAGFALASTDGESGYVLYHSTAAGGVRSAIFNPATVVQTVAPFMVEADGATTNINCGLVRQDATHVRAFWDRADLVTTNALSKWTQISSVGVVSSLRTLQNHTLASKPYVYGPDIYINVAYARQTLLPEMQISYATIRTFLANTPPMVPVATHAYRTAPTSFRNGNLPDVCSPRSGVFRFSNAISYKFLTTGSPSFGIASFDTDYTSSCRLLPLEVNGDVLFANGSPVKFDGRLVTENNFIEYPEIVSTAAGAVGGNGMDNGTFRYIAIYETSDAKGNSARSTTSVSVAATTTAGAGLGKVTVVVTQLSMTRFGWITDRQQGTVSLFRTKNAGTDYFFVASVPMDPTLLNSTIVDSTHDTLLGGHRQLYTNGGWLDREPPLPSRHMVLHQGRVWGISAADPKTIFYSGDVTPGEDVWFSNLQQFRVEPGGDAIALASLDDKLIVFKADRIFKVYGRGLNQLGQNSDLQLPQLISSDCGCIEPRSVVQTPDGVMFLSDKGIYMLTRAEQVVYIGAPVQYWTTNYGSCTSAPMLPDRREIRFSMSSPIAPLVTPACVDLVYNYDAKRWTTHLKYANKTSIDAVIVPGSGYVWAASAGDVYQENAGFLDPGETYIVMTLETGWIRPAGLQGFARCGRELFLGESKDDHGLEIQVAKDYSDAYTMDFRWSRTTLNSIAGEQVAAQLMDQKGESFRTRISDYADGGTPGAGYTARGLLLKARTIRAGTAEKTMSSGAKS